MDKDKKAEKKSGKAKSNIAITVGSVIVFVLIFISFIILPSFVGAGTRELPVFGKWGRKAVKYENGSYFNQSLNYYGSQIQNNSNYNEYIMQLLYRNAFQQAFNETIRRYAFIDYVEKTGFVASEDKINKMILNEFRDTNGNINEKVYRETKDSQKAAMRKNFTDDECANRFLLDYFSKDVIGNAEGFNYAVATSNAEIAFNTKMNSTSKNFDAIVFSTDDLPNSEIEKFALENADMFNEYSFYAISVESESIAKKILSQIKSQEITFEDAVSEYSKSYYSTSDGKLKNRYEYQIIATLANENDFEKIADLQKDEISPVIKTGTGYTIYKCTQPMKTVDVTDSALIDVVSTYLKTNEMGRVQDYFIENANKFIEAANAKGFDKACKEFGKEKKTTHNYVLNFANSSLLNSSETDIDELSNAYSNEDFLKKLFALKDNEISQPIVVENAIVVLKALPASANSTEPTENLVYRTNTTNFDYQTVISGIFASKKFKNNFDEVYTKNFTSEAK